MSRARWHRSIPLAEIRGSGGNGRPARASVYRQRLALEPLERRVLPSFVAPAQFPTGAYPDGVATGDFNGDGIPDLVTANDSSVSVLLGVGDDTFRPKVDYTAGSRLSSVAVADLNGDSVPDLITTNWADNTVSVLLGVGDGSFRPKMDFATGTFPQAVVVADLNGDGIPDLAVANMVSNNVSVLLGNGDGSFQAKVDYAAGTSPQAVAVGDFNQDGIPDLVVADYGSAPANSGVSVLLGVGDGTFQPARLAAAGTSPDAVVVGDFNGDGTADLAIATNGTLPDYHGTASVLLGNGDGTFRTPVTFGTGTFTTNLAVGDLNGDGIPDLVAGNQGYYPVGGSLSVLLGVGDGTFRAAVNYPTGFGSGPVARGDWNRDGTTDLATTNAGDSTVSVLLGRPDGSFGGGLIYNAGTDPNAVAVGDFNGDGIPDLAVVNQVANGTVTIFLGNGDGSFRLAGSFDTGYYSETLAVGDFNGDGIPDLAVVDPNTSEVAVLLGNGDGSFQAPLFTAVSSRIVAVAVADLNGDGLLDLITVDSGTLPQNGTVGVLLGNGNGTFRPPVTYAAGPTASAVAVGDFNGDGVPDLAVANNGSYLGNDSTVSLLLGVGDGSFRPAVSYPVGNRALAVAVGDFNGDGVPDLATANAANPAGTVSILLGNGDGSFRAHRDYSAGASPVALAVADFNGDAATDLATVTLRGTVNVLLGNGDGTLRDFQSYWGNLGGLNSAIATGDFNGDGFPDLVTANYYSNTIAVLLNAADWPAHPGTPSDPRGGFPPAREIPDPRLGTFPGGPCLLGVTPASGPIGAASPEAGRFVPTGEPRDAVNPGDQRGEAPVAWYSFRSWVDHLAPFELDLGSALDSTPLRFPL